MQVPFARDLDEGRDSTAIVPIGSFEQHGRHLACDTDTRIAGIIGARLADRLDATLLSPIPVTTSHEHSSFGGTASVPYNVCGEYVRQVCLGLRGAGFGTVVIVNGHGGNYWVHNVVQELNESRPWVVLAPSKQAMQAAYQEAGLSRTISEDMHAGEYETSILLAFDPGAVRSDAIADEAAVPRPLLNTLGMAGYTSTGVIGQPSAATPEKGRIIVDTLEALTVANVEAAQAAS